MQDLQARTDVINDPEIDAQGYDKIRSRIEVDTKDGRTLVQWADERYRGGPLQSDQRRRSRGQVSHVRRGRRRPRRPGRTAAAGARIR